MLKHVTNTQPEDIVLLRSIADHNESAFTQLYSRYQPKLLKFCAAYFNGDVELAADIVDDALFDVWNKAASYKETAKVSTWVFTITRNKAVDFLRKKREFSLNNDEDLLVEDNAASPDKLVSQEHEVERVQICLEKLSEMHREMILLMYYQGMTIKEISQVTNCPENTVKTRMFHAREKMNTMLLRLGIEGYP